MYVLYMYISLKMKRTFQKSSDVKNWAVRMSENPGDR